MARRKEIIKGKTIDGVIEIRLDHWKHFSKFITRDLLDFPAYIFRGQSSVSWKLESSFDRLSKNKRLYPGTLLPISWALTNASKGRRGKNPQILENDDEWWALAQHNGLATPLLDFTMSAFVALYFAFCDNTYKGKERTVYALHFYNLVEKMKTLNDDDEKVKLFYPNSDENDRLINQSGLFIKMPINTNLEDFIIKHFKNRKKGALLVKIIIPNTDVDKCMIMLNKMNINHSTLFPDLFGAATYVNYSFGKTKYDNISHFNLDL